MVVPLHTPADIGALIKSRRHALKLDQAALAQRVGVSRLWVNQVERGKPGASLGLVLRTLATLGVELTAEGTRQPAGEGSAASVAPVFSPDIDAIVADARRRDRR